MVKKLMARQDFYTVPGIVVFLFIAFAGTAFAQGGRLPVTAKPRTFLTPLPLRFVIHPGEAGHPRGICPTRHAARSGVRLIRHDGPPDFSSAE